jgi:hypothetical protein
MKPEDLRKMLGFYLTKEVTPSCSVPVSYLYYIKSNYNFLGEE